MPPATLGSYPIERELGRGGMGVVYLGHDRRLDRPVAIKVLSGALAAHPESLARFEREAKTLAAVSHPNIAAIYGIEQTADAQPLLILEYVPGETLADRLAHGPLPVGEAIEVARQIASAVEAAHDRGIIHRDLKPGNVKITPDGQIKVLDFGLAKGTTGTESADMAQSPTFTSPATAAGVILGTAGYMSPEQARGRVVDKRSDIWSFGCVLFESLTGGRAFDGETVSDTIAHILQREPDWSTLPAETPPRVRALLRRCLEKDLRRRQRDIGDVRLELEDAMTAPPGGVEPGPTAARQPALRSWLVAGAALVIGVILGMTAWATIRARGQAAPAAPLRVSITFPSSLHVRDYKILPDGSRLILRASAATGADQRTRLYSRPLDSFEAMPIAGTDGADRFVFSPDGRWMAVLVRVDAAAGEKRLVKVPTDGSAPPVTLGHWDPKWFDSLIWLDDGDLLLTRGESTGQVIFRISTATGEVSAPVKVDLGAAGILRTGGRTLPGHGAFVQVDTFGTRGYQTNIWLLDPTTGRGTQIVENAAEPHLLDSGHLLFSRGDTVMAAPFDPVKRAITGELTAVLSGLSSPVGPAYFAVAENGTLVYLSGVDDVLLRTLVVIDAEGSASPFVPDAGRFTSPLALSPEGGRVAVTVLNATATYETWIADATRATLRRMIASPKADVSGAIWSRDGKSLAYYREALDSEDGIHVQRVDGSGEARRIVASASTASEFVTPGSWLPDGLAMIVTRAVAQNRDLGITSFRTDGGLAEVSTLRATPYNEQNGVLSSDGSLLAFSSDESGQVEIYVAAFSNGAIGTPVPVSRGANTVARWKPGTRRLYYCDPANRLVFVDISANPTLTASAPVVALDLAKHRLLSSGWDIAADGRIVGIRRSEREEAMPPINLVLNWVAEVTSRLKRF